jgi:hypothetical protein
MAAEEENKCEKFISEKTSPILILAIPPITASVDQLLPARRP